MRSALTFLLLFCAAGVSGVDPQYGRINGWGTLIDPDGDCGFLVEHDRLSIRVPGKPHDLSSELNRTNAPRVLQQVTGDFLVEVQVGGKFQPGESTIRSRTSFNGAGLLLWHDARNYIRLERAALERSGSASHYVNFEERANGRVVRLGQASDFPIDESKTCYLRLERKGQRIHGSVRQGDGAWQNLTPKTTKLPELVEIGVAAINASDAPFAPTFIGLRKTISGVDKQPPPKSIAESQSKPESKEDPYAVPDENVAELAAFIRKLKTMRPRSRVELTKHSVRSPKALKEAAERIMKLEDDPASEPYKLAQRILFEQRIRDVSRLTESQQRSLLDEIVAFSSQNGAAADDSQMIYSLARSLEYAKRTEMAAEAYTAASESLAKSGSKALIKQAEKMAGAARRMELLGSEMEVHGTLMNGDEFDLASYRGKVVLVDFWATWCGPCVAELPNVKKYYELYHDKGFEVVGVCLDTSREKLEKFVEARDITWVNLFEDGAGWDHPIANHYGVMGIPTVILLNREGKAVSLKARGAELGRHLEEELGPIDPERLREVEAKMRTSIAARDRRPTEVTKALPPLIVYQDSAVYISKSDGSEFRRVARDDDYQWHGGPVISPDGKQLAWDAHRAGLKSPAVFVGDLDGNVVHKLDGVTRPTWLSDTVLLVDRSGSIVKVRLDSDLKQEVLLKGSFASLSANRRYLVFARGSSTVIQNLESDEEKVVRLQPRPRSFNGFAVTNDGKRVAFVGLKERGEGVYVADVADGKGKMVADEQGAEHFPRFSPDGTRLMFTAGSITLGADQAVSRIYIVNLASGDSTAITSDEFHCRDGSWSSDGESVSLVAVEKSTLKVEKQDVKRPVASKIGVELKKLGLALHNHHAAFKQLPPRNAGTSSNLSWRVHALPFLGEQELYREFKLDEPWDTDHNRKLIDRIPDVFAWASEELGREGTTRIVFPFHADAIYSDRGRGTRFREVLDGLSNTILAVVADEDKAVTWTRPDDLAIDLEKPRQGWSQGVDGAVTVLMADGAVVPLSPDVPDEVVGHLLTRAGKERIDTPLRGGVPKSTGKAPSQNAYVVPDSNVEDLVAFIEKIRAMRPRTRDEYIAHALRSPKALATAADRILKSDDAPVEARRLSQRVLFEQDIKSISRLNETKQRTLLDDILAFCSDSESDEDNSQLVSSLARSLEYAKRTEMAAEAYTAASESLAKSGSKALIKQAEKMAGAARRMELLGSEMEVHGTLMNGDEFDLASYRGKVVLVDFWATWCGPCVAELPNVKKYYELYHDKGFEVVGVCLDTSREKLEKFVEARDITWVNLFEDGAGWDHPIANHYGVMGIPTVILLNREGKAVSLKARGAELGRHLEEELGPIDPERLREVEAKMRQESRAAASSKSLKTSSRPRAQLDEGNAIYVACGPVNGPGKVYQLDDRGRILGSVDLPATPYGIDVQRDGLVLAMPRRGLLKIDLEGTYRPLVESEISRALDVAIHAETGELIVADNQADNLWQVSANPEVKPRRIQSFKGAEGHMQSMSIDVTADNHLLFASTNPKGVFRLALTQDAPLGKAIIDEAGGVAADKASTRWAAATQAGLHVFDKDKQIAEIPFPPDQPGYRSGIVASTNGVFVTALGSGPRPELVEIDPESKNMRSFFAWGRERLVDFAVGPRLPWSGKQTSTDVANVAGDELSFVSFDPPLPHEFKTGERLNVKFAYKLLSGTNCRLFVRPMTDGARTSGYGAHGSPNYERGNGEAEGWFTFQKPSRIDQVRIQMVDGSTREASLELLVDADATWNEDD